MRLVRILAVPAILLLTAPLAMAQPQAAPTRVAIANPARVFNDIQETRDLQAKFKNDFDALQIQRKEREVKLNDLKENRDRLKSDAPGWPERNQELLRAAIEFEVWTRQTQADLERQQKAQMKMIFDRITEAVAQVASSKGIDLVIAEVKPDVPADLNDIQLNDLRVRLVSRNVLYNSPQVDITTDVIAAMDAKYKAGN